MRLSQFTPHISSLHILPLKQVITAQTLYLVLQPPAGLALHCPDVWNIMFLMVPKHVNDEDYGSYLAGGEQGFM